MSMKPTSIRSMNSRAAAELLLGRGLSMGALPRDVACEQGGNGALGLGQLLPAAPQARLKAGQLRLQIRAFVSARVLADVGAARWPYVDQALGCEQPDGGLSGVLGHAMNVAELPVRRHPRPGRVRSVPDLGPQGIREASARESIGAWRRHAASIATCLKTVLDAATTADYCVNTVLTGSSQYPLNSRSGQLTTAEEY
jgi:hypothetical protein